MKFSEKIMVEEYLNESKKDIESYIKRIKNKAKKDYAQRYYTWKLKGEKGEEPDRGSLSAMGAQAVRMQLEDLMESTVNEAPIAAKGWSQKSIDKFEKTVGKKVDEKGFFDACVSRMEKHMGEQAKGFCSAIKDARHGSGHWRGRGKTEKEVEADVKANQFPKSKQLPLYRKKLKKKT
jgi:hypothetical protein